MSTVHTVKQGEHAARIAAQYGFFNFLTIWDHPRNAELKNKRRNPNVLFPGDQLFIPDKQIKKEGRQTGARHRFKIPSPQLMLRIVVQNYGKRPVANTPCELAVEGSVKPLTTDGNGQIEQKIPVTAEIAKLTIRETEFSIRIGHLDPVEEQSGLEARLNNLGYYVPPKDDRDEDELRSAIEEFQRDHDLKPPTGVADQATRARLVEAHGC
jgi:N-acetylmuramoyl-L-alanine amidase